MFDRKGKRLGVSWILVTAALLLPVATAAIAQMGPERGQMMRDQGMSDLPMKVPPAPTPFYRERTFLVLLGAGIAAFGIIAYRVGRSRWRGNSAPAEFVSEAVLVVDLVGSTHLATHFGETFALRAAEVLQERTLAWAQNRGLLFVKNTGDGCFMTFSTVLAACETAIALLRDVINRPPDLAPLPALELRAGISYGEILMDSARDRHASAINKAFRLEGLSRESFAQVEGENSKVSEIAERNRIFLDEEAAQELQNPGSSTVPLRFLGFARLRGFSGLHRVYEVLWTSVAPPGSGRAEQEGGESRLQ